jgi:hypothetical protein
MLDKPRIRAFAEFIRIHCEQTMLDCLERNEKDGIVYHYKGQLVGDYDDVDSQEAVMQLLLTGKSN